MTTVVDLLSSVKDEILARYKSPFWGVAFLSLVITHWKVVLFFLFGTPSSGEAIEFVINHVSGFSVASAVGFSIVYVVIFPWFEFLLSKVASHGVRSRNKFQIREREKEIAVRKFIAQEEAVALDIELKNRVDQSRLADIELAKRYQLILSGENFGRWLKDVQRGGVNTGLQNAIVDYLNKVDTVEGKFLNQIVESVHEEFVRAISLVQSILNDSRPVGDDRKKQDLIHAAEDASSALKNYRSQVRETLGI